MLGQPIPPRFIPSFRPRSTTTLISRYSPSISSYGIERYFILYQLQKLCTDTQFLSRNNFTSISNVDFATNIRKIDTINQSWITCTIFCWQTLDKNSRKKKIIDDNRNESQPTIPRSGSFQTLVDSRFSVSKSPASLQYGYLPLLCMIYGRSYQKSGYWNFNIRYNRPSRSTVATTTTAHTVHDLPARISHTELPSGCSSPRVQTISSNVYLFIRVIFQFWKSIGRKRSCHTDANRYKLHMSPRFPRLHPPPLLFHRWNR